MPEAVASNSIPLFERQPSENLDVLASLDAEIDRLESLHYLTTLAFSYVYEKPIAAGMKGMLRHEVERLRGLAALIREKRPMPAASPRFAGSKVSIWPELFVKVRNVVIDVFRDAGRELPEGDEASWDDEGGVVREIVTMTSAYHNELLAALGGSRDAFEAGSMLPWIELRIRREVGVETEKAATNDTLSLRDRIILEKMREGVSPSDLSQALSLRRGAVDRVIARLTERQDGVGREAS